MSLRFIFGRAGTGKSTQCINEIYQEVSSQPLGTPLIFLVPEQATHQMEMKLTHIPELRGILRAQVLSFRRLGWRIFSETGGGQKLLLGEVGKRMILRRLLLKHRSELRVFARSATRPGMADLLAQTIAEFKIYRITPTDLRQVKNIDEQLDQKLAELAFLYEAFNQSLGQDVRDPDDELTIVAEKIVSAPSLHKIKIWVDGFKGFTPQELYVLQALLKTAAHVTVTLPLDPQIISRSNGKTVRFKPGEEIFSGSWQTYQALTQLASESGVELESPLFLEENHRFQNLWLKHMERYYHSYPTHALTSDMLSESFQPCVTILSAVNRRAEVEGVARELRRFAREEGKSWNDLAVVTRDLTGYQDVLEQVFRAYEIPYFLDNKRSVLHHPLLELILSALETARTNWAYEPLFRCLKTDFFPCTKDAIDRLENYCLAHGIHGEAWSSGRDWHYRSKWSLDDPKFGLESDQKLDALINQTRQTIYEALKPLMEQLGQIEQPEHHEELENPEHAEHAGPDQATSLSKSKAAETPGLNVRRITEGIYDLLVRLEVPARLRQWAKEAQSRGDLAEARLQEQIWEAVIEVLDEMVAGLGDEQLELADYALILSSGLENLKLGLIPPSLDQVLVGSLERSRNPELNVLFILGANEGILPAKPGSDGVLDSLERESLEQLGLALAPKGKAQLYEEQYFIYNALTRATEQLFISYPLTDEEGKGLVISPVITRLRTIFPELKERYIGHPEEELALISHAQALLPAYAVQLLETRQGKELPPLWQAVQKWFLNKMADFPQVQLLQQGIMAENRADRLPKPLARRLYGKRLLTSVSRLERYARCPFAHYAQYGLKLQERSTYQLKSPEMGQFFHAVLRDFALTVHERQLDWGNLSKGESWELVSELSEKIVPLLQNEILLSNSRYRYLTYKLKRTVHHAVRVLGEHSRQGIFVPIQFEVKFGPGEAIPGLEIPLSDGDALILRGQIDRIDGAMLQNQIYLRILDYKSRPARVTLNQIFYGLDLQLLAYLDTALQGAEILLNPDNLNWDKLNSDLPGAELTASELSAAELSATEKPASDITSVRPAGFLYFPVLEPQLESKVSLTQEQIEHERVKAVKVKGYLLANRQILEAMDRSLIDGDSDLLGLKIKKDGEFKKGSPILTEEQFALLRKHLRDFLTGCGEEILNGNIEIAPYRQGKDYACQYCTYRPVCQFDPSLPENPYRNLPVIKDPEIWKNISANSLPDSQSDSQPDSQSDLKSGLDSNLQASLKSASITRPEIRLRQAPINSLPAEPAAPHSPHASDKSGTELLWLGEEETESLGRGGKDHE